MSSLTCEACGERFTQEGRGRRRKWCDDCRMGMRGPTDSRHGTVPGYNAMGCRCDECRAAEAAYQRDLYQRHKNGHRGPSRPHHHARPALPAPTGPDPLILEVFRLLPNKGEPFDNRTEWWALLNIAMDLAYPSEQLASR